MMISVRERARELTDNATGAPRKSAPWCASSQRSRSIGGVIRKPVRLTEETRMWTKPEFTDIRFGFEITMYIFNR